MCRAQNKGQANGYIPMGSVNVTLKRTDKQAFGFELGAAALGKRNFQLAAEDEASLNKWLSAIKQVNVKRVKTIVWDVVEELEKRGYAGVEGIFRLSGGKDAISALKKEYDLGLCLDPSLSILSIYRSIVSTCAMLCCAVLRTFLTPQMSTCGLSRQ